MGASKKEENSSQFSVEETFSNQFKAFATLTSHFTEPSGVHRHLRKSVPIFSWPIRADESGAEMICWKAYLSCKERIYGKKSRSSLEGRTQGRKRNPDDRQRSVDGHTLLVQHAF